MADQALARHNADDMIEKISRHMADAIDERFNRVMEAEKHKNESVAAGRDYVDAYVTYIHYVEGVHNAIASTVDHH